MTGVRQHTVVWMVRHGQTDWNQEQRYLSVADRPLTALGLAQAQALGEHLRRFAVGEAISSGMQRTRETMRAILRGQRRPAPTTEDGRWTDPDQGRWEGLRYADVIAQFADEATARWADPWHAAAQGGETLEAVQARVRAAWRDLVRCASGAKVLLVADATPIQLVLCDLLGVDAVRYWQVRIDVGSLTAVDLYPTAAIMRSINYVPPLRPASVRRLRRKVLSKQ